MAELEKLQVELQEAVRESEKLKVKALSLVASRGVTLQLTIHFVCKGKELLIVLF